MVTVCDTYDKVIMLPVGERRVLGADIERRVIGAVSVPEAGVGRLDELGRADDSVGGQARAPFGGRCGYGGCLGDRCCSCFRRWLRAGVLGAAISHGELHQTFERKVKF